MKQFHELTKEQQGKAVQFAVKTVKDLIGEGVIVSSKPMANAEVADVAEAMAENAFYSEKSDLVIADIADGK